MTLVPMYKRCPKCKRRYSWNPDIGNMTCPYCNSRWRKVLKTIAQWFEFPKEDN